MKFVDEVVITAKAGDGGNGCVSFRREKYIEYHSGSLPIILSAAHGGWKEPTEIPDRTEGTMVTDINTYQLTKVIMDTLTARFGGKPHVILCLLERLKLDANRDVDEAAGGNLYAERAWEEYHHYLDIAKERLPGFVGVKFTNQDYDLLQRCMANTSVKADMLFGTDERLIEGLGFGCVGAVGSTYNFASPLYLRIINAFNRGDMESAKEDQAQSLQMIKRMYQSGFAAACKAAMGFAGVDCGPVRPPIDRISAENLVSLRKDLDAMDFFDWAIK